MESLEIAPSSPSRGIFDTQFAFGNCSCSVFVNKAIPLERQTSLSLSFKYLKILLILAPLPKTNNVGSINFIINAGALWVEVYVHLFVGASSPADDVITCPLPGTHSLASAVAVSCCPRSDALPMLPYVI